MPKDRVHVLLITSEDLNDKNVYASSFELQQAKALKDHGVDVSILSIGILSIRSIGRAILNKIWRKKNEHYRLKRKNFFQLCGLFISSGIKLFSRKKTINSFTIEGIPVYESFATKNNFQFDEKGHEEWTRIGYKGFQYYLRKKGAPDIVHAHSRILLAGLLAYEIAKKNNIPYILTEHSSFYARGLVKDFQIPLLKKTIRGARNFITVSDRLGKWVNEKLQENFSYNVIPNIINWQFEDLPIKKKNTHRFTFLNVASLDENKNHAILLKAFSILSMSGDDSILKIVGSGEKLEALVTEAKTLEISSRVKFLGQLNTDQILRELQNCDAFVLSSYFETFGVVIIEAFACGKPVISTRCGGPEELITPANGLLVKNNDAIEIAGAMQQMKSSLGQYSPDVIKANCMKLFSRRIIAQKLLDIYCEALTN